jgi:DHA3 family multidrug efflux protein-like MFS transporter
LANCLAAFLTNTFVWFAVTFWVYLETKSVIATAVMAGVYTTTVAISGFFLGSLVDQFPKKRVMLLSSIVSLVLYVLVYFIFVATPSEVFKDANSLNLWLFIVLSLFGAIAGNLRGIAISTLVTILVPEDERDRANGLVGTANGIAFLGASIFSGLVIGYLGVAWMLVIAIILTILVILHLWTLSIPDLPKKIRHSHGGEPEHEHDEPREGVDIRGTILAIQLVPGLFGLIFFHTFNNFLGGIFMSLMDAYGLLLVSVQVWGALWGILSLAFIVGGMVVASKGLGKNPLRTLFLANIAMWTICIFFTIQASIVG